MVYFILIAHLSGEQLYVAGGTTLLISQVLIIDGFNSKFYIISCEVRSLYFIS